MSFSSTITITGSTNITNFDIYQCPTSGCTGCVAITGSTGENVSRMKLLTGHTVTVSQGFRYIKLVADTETCNNSICMEVIGIPTLTPTPTPTGTATPTPTPTPTPTATNIPNSTSTPTPTPTTAPITNTPTPTATNTPTPTPTATSTPTPTPTPTSGGVQITNCVKLTVGTATFDDICPFNRIQRHTVTLYDATGATEVNAPYDITVTLTGTEGGSPSTFDIIIPTGQSSAYEDIYTREQLSGSCGDRDGLISRIYRGVSPSPSNIGVCAPPPQPTGTTLTTFYYGQGLTNSNSHCGTDYTINADFYSSSTTISGLLNSTMYTTSNGTTAFNGLNLWWPVRIDSTPTTTLNGNYWSILIDSNGYVGDVVYINGSCQVNTN